MDDIYREILILFVLALLGGMTHFRVRKQESGWERLIASTRAQLSGQQKALTEALTHNVELQQALRKARAEAVMCPHPHPHTETLDVTGQIAQGSWD